MAPWYGFWISYWVDAVVTTLRGHRLTRLYCRTLSEWQEALRALGFEVQVQPMSEGTPFANIMLVARVQPLATGAEATTAAAR